MECYTCLRLQNKRLQFWTAKATGFGACPNAQGGKISCRCSLFSPAAAAAATGYPVSKILIFLFYKIIFCKHILKTPISSQQITDRVRQRIFHFLTNKLKVCQSRDFVPRLTSGTCNGKAPLPESPSTHWLFPLIVLMSDLSSCLTVYPIFLFFFWPFRDNHNL